MSAWRKLLYSFGSLGASLPNQAFSAYAIYFYVDQLKAPPVGLGAIMTLYGLWNAFNDPMLGYLSDRTQTRWGRRIPYIVAGIIPLAVSYALLWAPPAQLVARSDRGGLLLYFAVAVFLYDLFYTMVVLNWTSLFPEMFPTLRERASVSAMRQVFGLVGAMLGIGLTTALVALSSWAAVGTAFAVVAAISLAVSLLGSREDPRFARAQAPPLGAALRYTLANRAFLTFALTSFTTQLTFNVIIGSIRFYTRYALGLDEFQNSLVTLSAMLVIVAMLPVWALRAAAVGPRRSMMEGIALFLVTLSGFWVASDLASAALAAAVAGVAMAGPVLLWDVLIADVIDEDEVRSGVRREGMYFGMHALILRAGIAIQGLLITGLPSALGYDPALPQQPASAVLGFRLLMTAVPAAILLVALVCIYFYPLHGERLRGVREALARKRRDERTVPAAAAPGGRS